MGDWDAEIGSWRLFILPLISLLTSEGQGLDGLERDWMAWKASGLSIYGEGAARR